MKITFIKKEFSDENEWMATLHLNEKHVTVLGSFREVLTRLIRLKGGSLDAKKVFFKSNASIGIERVDKSMWNETHTYKVVYSEIPELLNTTFELCNKDFKRAIGKFSYYFYNTYYFKITKANE